LHRPLVSHGCGLSFEPFIKYSLLSSASSIASAATLISHGELPVMTGVNGIILSSLTSILANIPLIRSLMKEAEFKNSVCTALIIIAAAGLTAGIINHLLFAVSPSVK
jgi:hypothetical protein